MTVNIGCLENASANDISQKNFSLASSLKVFGTRPESNHILCQDITGMVFR